MCEVYLLSGYFSQNILSFWTRILRIIHCIYDYIDHSSDYLLILYVRILVDDKGKTDEIIANKEYIL